MPPHVSLTELCQNASKRIIIPVISQMVLHNLLPTRYDRYPLVVLQAKLSYQDSLLQQISYQKTVRAMEKEQAQREIALHKEAEACYQQKVQAALTHPHPDKIHPRRLSGHAL